MSFRFVIGIHIIIEHFQETWIFVAIGIVIDVFHGIQTETIHTTIYPTFGCFGQCFICTRFACLVHRPVIQIGKPVGIEMRMEVECLHKIEFDVRSCLVVQGERFAQLADYARSGTILRAIVPSGVTGTNQEAPIRIKVYGQFVLAISLIIETECLVIASIP